jgi:hypothetical protein
MLQYNHITLTKMAKEKKEPSFIDQAFAKIEAHYKNSTDKHGMTIADHKLLCQILDAHEGYVDEKIITAFCEKISEHYSPIMLLLEKMDLRQEEIVTVLTSIEQRLKVVEERADINKSRLDGHETKIEKNEKDIGKLEREIEDIKKVVDPNIIVKYLHNMWWKIVLFGLAILLIAIAVISYLHSNGYLSFLKSADAHLIDDKIKAKEEIYQPINVRGSHIYGYTKEQKDSIDKAIAKRQIQEIDEIISKQSK